MNATVVDRLHSEFTDLIGMLKDEPSMQIVAWDNLRKSLLMAAASYFEQRMTENVLNFVKAITEDNHVLVHFVKNKAISRQYHTWFDWDNKSANRFFGLFGEPFKKYMEKLVSEDAGLKASIEAFLEVGSERNRLIHQDFGSFSLEKTIEEVFDLYSTARPFVERFPKEIAEFVKGCSAKQE